jgi:hypothetical protein
LDNPTDTSCRLFHVAVQHRAAQPGHFESASKALMGLHPSGSGW